MDKKAFKQRMQDLKSYRGNNPGKGYWDWRNSLPDNLKYTDDTEYNMQGAYEAGLQPEYVYEDDSYHLPSRNPNTGEILKKSIHPTYWKGLEEDARLGYDAYHLGDRTWTSKKGDAPIQAFANGGETGDPKKEEFYRRTGRSATGRPLEQGIKLAFDIEDAANFTPVGDVISANDTYDAVKRRDWVGAGLAALGVLPFVPNMAKKVVRNIPTVNKDLEQKAINEVIQSRIVPPRVQEAYYNQRNRAFELMNTPEARRRAQNIDSKYGTEYGDVYNELTELYESTDGYFNMPEPRYVSAPNDKANINPREGGVINISRENVKAPEDLTEGVIRHEIGHFVDALAYPGGIPNNAYLKQLGKPSKYRDFEEVRSIFKNQDRARHNYDYLRKPTEKKSIMNQFDEYLMENYTPSTYPMNTKQFKEAIENAPSSQDLMKHLLKIHTKPSVLFKDFQMRPLVNHNNNDKNNILV